MLMASPKFEGQKAGEVRKGEVRCSPERWARERDLRGGSKSDGVLRT
jgi:hypothetical protein